MRAARFLPALPALAVLAAGCGDALPAAGPFASPRILAVAANPPVLEPGPEGMVELTPLVVDAAGNDITDDPRLELRWRMCNMWQPVNDPDVDCGPGDSVPLPFLGPDDRRTSLTFPLLGAAFPPPADLPDDYFDSPAGSCPGGGFYSIFVPVVLEARYEGYRLLALKRVPIDGGEGWRNPVIESVRLDDGMQQDGDIQYFTPGQWQSVLVSVGDEPTAECDEMGLYAYLANGDVAPSAQEVPAALAPMTVSLNLPEDRGSTLWLVITNRRTGGVGWRSLRLEPGAP